MKATSRRNRRRVSMETYMLPPRRRQEMGKRQVVRGSRVVICVKTKEASPVKRHATALSRATLGAAHQRHAPPAPPAPARRARHAMRAVAVHGAML